MPEPFVVSVLNLLGDHAAHFDDLVGVTPFIVVPCANLDEGRIELNAGLFIKGGGANFATEVGGDHCISGVAEHALEFTLCSFLHGSADFSVGSFLVELAGEVNEGDIRGGNAHGHTGEFTLELRKHHAHSLSSTGGGGDHVLKDTAAAAPVLLGGTVNGLLRSGSSVNGGHETALQAELVVDNLGDGSQAVGGAGRIGDDVLAGIGGVVHAIDEHRGGILGGSGHHHFLRAGFNVLAGGFVGEEETGGFNNDFCADFIPLELSRILFGGQANLLAIDDEGVAIDCDIVLKAAMHRVVLEHIGA